MTCKKREQEQIAQGLQLQKICGVVCKDTFRAQLAPGGPEIQNNIDGQRRERALPLALREA